MKKILNILLNIFKNLAKVAIGLVLIIAVLWLFYFSVDFVFKNVLPYISRAVLANFVLFAGVIIYLVVKLKIVDKMEDAKTAVKETITESEIAKEESETKLSNMEDSLAHLDKEIEAILTESDERAKLVGAKILDDAKNAVLVIQDNTTKALENSRVILKNDLIRRATLASVEVAKSHIIQELSINAELHDKLIDESIEKIEGVEL